MEDATRAIGVIVRFPIFMLGVICVSPFIPVWALMMVARTLWAFLESAFLNRPEMLQAYLKETSPSEFLDPYRRLWRWLVNGEWINGPN
jgi:hypothetical protein